MSEARGTITTGGTAQPLLPAASDRDHFSFQNNSSGPLTIGFEITPNADGPLIVPAGALFSALPGMMLAGAVQVWGATTGQKFSVWSY